ILESTDEVITVEGVVEDVDVVSGESIRAIQCKYHESVETYSNSKVYKPIAQMMSHYFKNPEQQISYVLFAHFPNEAAGVKNIDKEVINAIFTSTDTQI